MSNSTEPRWDHMRGSISTIDRQGTPITVFSLTASLAGKAWGQTVEVETARLARVPGLYKQTLDLMVRDIGARL